MSEHKYDYITVYNKYMNFFLLSIERCTSVCVLRIRCHKAVRCTQLSLAYIAGVYISVFGPRHIRSSSRDKCASVHYLSLVRITDYRRASMTI